MAEDYIATPYSEAVERWADATADLLNAGGHASREASVEVRAEELRRPLNALADDLTAAIIRTAAVSEEGDRVIASIASGLLTLADVLEAIAARIEEA